MPVRPLQAIMSRFNALSGDLARAAQDKRWDAALAVLGELRPMLDELASHGPAYGPQVARNRADLDLNEATLHWQAGHYERAGEPARRAWSYFAGPAFTLLRSTSMDRRSECAARLALALTWEGSLEEAGKVIGEVASMGAPPNDLLEAARSYHGAVSENRPSQGMVHLGAVEMATTTMEPPRDVYLPDGAADSTVTLERLSVSPVDPLSVEVELVVRYEAGPAAYARNEYWKYVSAQAGSPLHHLPVWIGALAWHPHRVDASSVEVTWSRPPGPNQSLVATGDWILFAPGAYPRLGPLPLPRHRSWQHTAGRGVLVRGRTSGTMTLKLRILRGAGADVPVLQVVLPAGNVHVKDARVDLPAGRTLLQASLELHGFFPLRDPKDFAGRIPYWSAYGHAPCPQGENLGSATDHMEGLSVRGPATLLVQADSQPAQDLDWGTWYQRLPLCSAVYGYTPLKRLLGTSQPHLHLTRPPEREVEAAPREMPFPMPAVIHRVRNLGTQARKVRLSARLDGDAIERTFTLPPGETRDLPMAPFLSPGLHPESGHVDLVTELGVSKLLGWDTRVRMKTLPVHGRQTWTWLVEDPVTGEALRLPHTLARWVTPEARAVRDLLPTYRRLNPEIAGLAPEHVPSMAGLVRLFDVLRFQKILYEPASGDSFTAFERGQRVRLPEQTLADKRGNCLDLCLLLASLAEAASLSPWITLIDAFPPEFPQGHALFGLRNGPHAYALEATFGVWWEGRGPREFTEAIDKGASIHRSIQARKNRVEASPDQPYTVHLTPEAPVPRHYQVILEDARNMGIVPMA